jgi:hypothetical protein
MWNMVGRYSLVKLARFLLLHHLVVTLTEGKRKLYEVMTDPTVLLGGEGLTKKDKDSSKVQSSVMIFLKCVHYPPEKITF